MIKGTRILMGDQARNYTTMLDTLRSCLH
jgi:hypothetical protein